MRGEKFRAILESGNEDLFKELLHSKTFMHTTFM
jgi:hypothetical protein